MTLKNHKFLKINRISSKKIFIVIGLIVSFLMIPLVQNIEINLSFNENGKKEKDEYTFLEENLKTQDLSTDNTFSGIGAPWNVTHYANGTKTNLPVRFTNNTPYDNSQFVELEEGWMGYQLNSTITNLYDTRNWINGTFHDVGTSDGGGANENDSYYIYNWTFYESDVDGGSGEVDNDFSGNYYDTDDTGSGGADCLELRIGQSSGEYDVGDKCWWETTFEMDRGDVDEALLKFAAFPKYSDTYNNHFTLQIIVNNKTLWGNGLASMLEACGNPNPGQWYNVTPIYLDTDDPDIFPTGVKDMNITFEFKRVSGNSNPNYWDEYSVLIDNISLIVKSKAKPSQLGLYLNGSQVNGDNYGEGYRGKLGTWNGSKIDVYANFSSNLNWPLSFDDDDYGWIKYKIEFETNLILYANKSTPESYYTPNPDDIYQGSAFVVANSTDVNWTTYAHMEIPTRYEETNMTLEYPSDYNLKEVFFSQTNVSFDDLNITNYGNKKVVNIPVSNITTNTNLFWRLKAESPNYCLGMDIYNNDTSEWIPRNVFTNGTWINITANIKKSQLISGYINKTEAQLQIRFPDDSIWTAENQFKQVNDTGIVYFDPIFIPSDGSNYMVGEYEAIVTWNNSYSNFNLFNETGIIYKKFTVTHNSTLKALDNYYEDVVYGDTINLEVTFKDVRYNKPIEGANITLRNFTGEIQTFKDLDNGYYLLIFNTTGGDAGENILTIHASHPSYLDDEVNITIEVIFSTDLYAEEFSGIEVPWNNNFTVHLNYTYSNASVINGVEGATPIINNWNDDWSYITSGGGLYNITCNTSKYQVNTAPNLRIDFNETGYESQTIIISIEVVERQTSITEIIIDDNNCTINKTANIYSGAMANITVKYMDLDAMSESLIQNATISLNGTGIGEVFTENYKFYNLTLNSTKLGVGIFILNIIAQKDNYTTITEKLTINIYTRETEYWVYFNGTIQTEQNPTIPLYKNQYLNITFTYNDTILKEHIPGATVDINGSSVSKVLEDKFNNYSVLIDTNELNQGVNFLTIYARKDGYEPQTISIVVEIGQIGTSLTIIMNGKDLTNNPVFNLTIGQSINLTVKYTDLNGVFIDNATVLLIGEDLSLDLVKDNNYDQYYRILNSTELRIGAKLFTIVAQKSNFQSLTKDLRITVNKIAAEIRSVSGVAQIEAEVGDNILLQVILNDTIFGADITNATITYNSPYYQGELKYSGQDNIYEDTIDNVREGVHTITISAFAGDNYDFKSYTITLVVISPTTSPPPDLSWLIYVLVAGIVGLVSFFAVHQMYLKYPPMVRKIRKLKKNVKKSKRTKPIIVDKRDEIIGKELQNQIKSVDYEFIQPEEIDKVEKVIKKEGGVD